MDQDYIVRWQPDLVNTKETILPVCDKPYHKNNRILQMWEELELCIHSRTVKRKNFPTIKSREKPTLTVILGVYSLTSYPEVGAWDLCKLSFLVHVTTIRQRIIKGQGILLRILKFLAWVNCIRHKRCVPHLNDCMVNSHIHNSNFSTVNVGVTT